MNAAIWKGNRLVCNGCGSTLEGITYPLKGKGRGRCPAGGGDMDYSVDPLEYEEVNAIDSTGNLTKVKRPKVEVGDNQHTP